MRVCWRGATERPVENLDRWGTETAEVTACFGDHQACLSSYWVHWTLLTTIASHASWTNGCQKGWEIASLGWVGVTCQSHVKFDGPRRARVRFRWPHARSLQPDSTFRFVKAKLDHLQVQRVPQTSQSIASKEQSVTVISDHISTPEELLKASTRRRIAVEIPSIPPIFR